MISRLKLKELDLKQKQIDQERELKQKEIDVREKQIQVESETQLKMKSMDVDSHAEISATKLKSQQEENKFNKYKNIIKPYCKEDSISAWTENVEYQFKYHQVPLDMWAPALHEESKW